MFLLFFPLNRTVTLFIKQKISLQHTVILLLTLFFVAVLFVVDITSYSGFAMEDIPYTVGGPDAVQKLDTELKADLTELKTELEENEIIRGASRPAR